MFSSSSLLGFFKKRPSEFFLASVFSVCDQFHMVCVITSIGWRLSFHSGTTSSCGPPLTRHRASDLLTSPRFFIFYFLHLFFAFFVAIASAGTRHRPSLSHRLPSAPSPSSPHDIATASGLSASPPLLSPLSKRSLAALRPSLSPSFSSGHFLPRLRVEYSPSHPPSLYIRLSSPRHAALSPHCTPSRT